MQLARPGAAVGEGREGFVLVLAVEHYIRIGAEPVAPVAAGLGRGGQQRVGDGPVGERAEAAARSPLAIAEGARGVVVEVAGGRGSAIVAVGLARGAVDDGGGDLRHVVGGLGELGLVVVVDVEDGVRDDHLAHRGLAPGEVRVAQEAVVAGERAEVVAVGVAVALRIELGGVLLVEDGLVVAP